MRTKEMQQRTAAVILQMKEIRKKRRLTLQQIYDMVEAAGKESGLYVSLSSIKRVFADGSENQGFRYDDTIQPIARVLLEVSEEMPAGSNADVEAEQLTALKELAVLKSQMMDELREDNEKLQAEIERNRVDYEKRVDYLKKDCARKNRIIAVLAIALAVVLLAIIAVRLYDKANPNVGWFRDLAAHFYNSSYSNNIQHGL